MLKAARAEAELKKVKWVEMGAESAMKTYRFTFTCYPADIEVIEDSIIGGGYILKREVTDKLIKP